MAEQEKVPLREPSSLEKFLAFVKDYKELATAITILAAGISWLFAYFATKEEFHGLRDTTHAETNALHGETKKLHCLMQKNVQILEGQQRWKKYQMS